ncbi:hypothetical protein A8B79_09255 [Balneola sp. EhC07]|uniref:hypothetical protein n=1 Tax=Balneola sp. EhC07 TaxID=1849360 RepID=UPI0007F39930|nr:hypothetical protein [Balneola sp. EhC07]OAN60699.1 hypothetical protein A8B79_09255 [Balneola sp. EhC07]
MSDKHRLYLRDLGFLIKERALEAKNEYQNPEADGKEYREGYLAAYTSIINTMLNQAVSFDIDEKDICLNDFDPENDLWN